MHIIHNLIKGYVTTINLKSALLRYSQKSIRTDCLSLSRKLVIIWVSIIYFGFLLLQKWFHLCPFIHLGLSMFVALPASFVVLLLTVYTPKDTYIVFFFYFFGKKKKLFALKNKFVLWGYKNKKLWKTVTNVLNF